MWVRGRRMSLCTKSASCNSFIFSKSSLFNRKNPPIRPRFLLKKPNLTTISHLLCFFATLYCQRVNRAKKRNKIKFGMMHRLLSLTALCCLLSLNLLYAQNFTLSGYAKDGRSGETLTGVNVYNKANSQQGTSTNNYGFYSLTLPTGKYTIKMSFVGYADREFEVNLTENTSKTIELTEGVELTSNSLSA